MRWSYLWGFPRHIARPAACKMNFVFFASQGVLPDLRCPDYSDYRVQVQKFYKTDEFARPLATPEPLLDGGGPTGSRHPSIRSERALI